MEIRRDQIEYEKLDLPPGEDVRFEEVKAADAGYYSAVSHFHEMHELVLFEQFKGTVRVDGVATDVDGACLVYLPSCVLHQFEIRPGTTRWYLIQFGNSLLDALGGFDRLGISESILPLDERLQRRLLELAEWYGESRNPDILRLLLGEVLHQRPEGPAAPLRRQHARFRGLLEHLESHDLYTMSLNDASRIVGLSRSQFVDRFKQQFGITFNQFLTNRRINAAIHLLKNSDLNVTEIAGRLAFNDSSYFTRVFRRETGMSPRELRKG